MVRAAYGDDSDTVASVDGGCTNLFMVVRVAYNGDDSLSFTIGDGGYTLLFVMVSVAYGDDSVSLAILVSFSHLFVVVRVAYMVMIVILLLLLMEATHIFVVVRVAYGNDSHIVAIVDGGCTHFCGG